MKPKIGPFTETIPNVNESSTLSLEDILAAKELLLSTIFEPPRQQHYFYPPNMSKTLWADMERRAQEEIDRYRRELRNELWLVARGDYGQVQLVRLVNIA